MNSVSTDRRKTLIEKKRKAEQIQKVRTKRWSDKDKKAMDSLLLEAYKIINNVG
jgi:hypothetical protein